MVKNLILYIKHWRIKEIENIIIPTLPKDLQKQIAEKIEFSFKLKDESKKLIDSSIRAVEVAIEDGEEKGSELL